MSWTSTEDVYESLVEIFCSRKSNESFEIEILLPGQGPLLRDGSFIGITKKALTKAFVIARKRFMQHLDHARADTVEEQTECAALTEIILLFDCEHTTACNWRKRRVAASINRYIAAKNTGRQTLQDLFESELNLITTFVCSPLHRHTKSPTLWQHRLWLMAERIRLQDHLQEDIFLRQEGMQRLILAEWKIVCKAGELHPKNYYAFNYIRQLHSHVSKLSERAVPVIIQDSALLHELAVMLVDPMLTWCLSNPKDVSGWVFLFYLLGHEDPPGKQDMKHLRKVAMERTLHFAVEITAWDGESLWTFVDLMMTKFGASILPGFYQSCAKPETTRETEISKQLNRPARWKTAKQNTTACYRKPHETT